MQEADRMTAKEYRARRDSKTKGREKNDQTNIESRI